MAEPDLPLVEWPGGDLLYSSRVRRWRPSERTRVVTGHVLVAAGILAVLLFLGALEGLIG
jgi:hypothetical protein